jgi:hypothetical protein
MPDAKTQTEIMDLSDRLLVSSPPTTPSKYPKLDHLPRVKDRRDQPTKIAVVNIGMTEESIPESRQDRY